MIRSVRHRGLKRLLQRSDVSGVRAEHRSRIENILTLLNVATRPSDLNLPGYRLHPLRGGFKGFWSVTVSGNWRIIFRMEDGDVYDVDLVDYH
jgi:toxin HigB-1